MLNYQWLIYMVWVWICWRFVKDLFLSIYYSMSNLRNKARYRANTENKGGTDESYRVSQKRRPLAIIVKVDISHHNWVKQESIIFQFWEPCVFFWETPYLTLRHLTEARDLWDPLIELETDTMQTSEELLTLVISYQRIWCWWFPPPSTHLR